MNEPFTNDCSEWHTTQYRRSVRTIGADLTSSLFLEGVLDIELLRNNGKGPFCAELNSIPVLDGIRFTGAGGNSIVTRWFSAEFAGGFHAWIWTDRNTRHHLPHRLACASRLRRTIAGKHMPPKKSKKQSDKATRASVRIEMAKPRVAKSARAAELNLNAHRMVELPSASAAGTILKIIPARRQGTHALAARLKR